MLEPPRQRADTALLLYAFGSFVAAPLVLFLFFALRHRAAERALPISLPVPEAAQPGWTGRVLAEPAISDASRPDVIVCYDPATAQHIADLPADSREQAEDKVRRADVARRAWGTSSFARRRRLLRTIKKWCVDDMEGIARVACRDTGKTVSDACWCCPAAP
jgi:delta 1-pyrroline-5-carboxylate dehydrogenase